MTAGRQLAEILEDREGWHGLDRADSAEAQGMTMTSEQIELARHALGLPNREKRSYRNHYVGEHAAWEAMVAAGLARKSSGSPLSGGDIVYWLTKPAAEAALSKGERLDPEDFPARMADNANPK